MTSNKTLAISFDSLIIATLTFLLIPLNLIANNTAEFSGFSYAEFFLYGSLFTLSASIISFLFLWGVNLASPNIRSKLATAIISYLVICGLYFSIHSGLMDGGNALHISYITFFCALLFSLLGANFAQKKLRLLIWIALIGATATTIISLSKIETIQPSKPNNEQLLQSGFFEISTNDKNIFVISFDALQSNYVKEILEKDTELKKAFDGFIQFENVTSVAPFTSLSTATTKIGMLPNENINSDELIQNYHDFFITNILNAEDYEVSTYAYFSKGEDPKKTNTVQTYQISPQQTNTYLMALNTSFNKYLPITPDILKETTNRFFMFIAKFQNNAYETLYTSILNDPRNSANQKIDLLQFNSYKENLTPVSNKKTAHFHHYIFTHNPVAYNAHCQYHMIADTRQNNDSALQEIECSLRAFADFIHTLKMLNAFDNSMIIFTSDHGVECSYTPIGSMDSHRVSKRWCLSRYKPLLMIKPLNHSGSLYSDPFNASLLDIAKTICDNASENTRLCGKYTGVDLLNIQPNDMQNKRETLVTKKNVHHDTREYKNFEIINIGRQQTVEKYFTAKDKSTPEFPVTFIARELPSSINADKVGNGRIAIPGKHKKGYIVFGSYLYLPIGEYELTIHYQSAPSKFRRVGRWNIATDGGKTIIKKGNLPSTDNQQQQITIPFSIKDKAKEVEFRVKFDGKYPLKVEQIVVNAIN